MAILLGIFIGLALGLTGGGGSILAVPFLIYGLGVEPKEAVTLSLAVVSIVALYGAASAWRHRLLEIRAAIIFAIGGIIAAPMGIMVGNRISDLTLVYAFAALMLIIAIRMFTNAIRKPSESRVVRGDFESGSENDSVTVCRYSADGRLRITTPCGLALVLLGLVTGFLSGLFGVGGGFLIVPSLMLVSAMGIHRAVASSLLVITIVGLSGTLSAWLSERPIDWVIMALFLAGGIIGMFIGRRTAHRLAGPALQKTFAVLIVCVAVYMLTQVWGYFPGAVITEH